MAGGKRPKRHRIPKVRLKENSDTLQFSFKHLDLGNDKYSISKCHRDFWEALARKLNEYSQWPVDQFVDQNYADHRHIIDFRQTTEPAGFWHLDTDQLGYEEPWQFKIGEHHWRVAGFILNGVFYIVWLDPDHALYAECGPGDPD